MSAVDDTTYWYTVIDVSEMLSLPLRRLYDLLETGQLRGRRIGRTVMIARPDVEALRVELTRRD